MDDMRLIRHGDVLRVAFTPKARRVRFAVRPAGEESKPEDNIPITSIKTLSTNLETKTTEHNIITVYGKRNERVVLDLYIQQDESYTGYGVVEYDTRGRT